eukprot:3365609-Amphidinium_carterae.1
MPTYGFAVSVSFELACNVPLTFPLVVIVSNNHNPNKSNPLNFHLHPPLLDIHQHCGFHCGDQGLRP